MSGAAPRLVVGIDLGTTNSLIAVPERGRPRVLRNALGEILTPSAVALGRDGEILVGRAALDRKTVSPDRVATSFKRDMGTDTTHRLGDRRMSPVELSACVLESLVRDAESVYGCVVDEAVVSVPAYFNDLQRRATLQAAEMAGLRVERLVNEPTAAAIAYGLDAASGGRAIVLDLGGGTFDVTVLEIIEGVVEIQSTAGDTRLGGDDFTDCLLREVLRRAGLGGEGEALEDASRARVRRACELGKRGLSRDERTRIRLADVRAGTRRLDLDVELSRDEADELWAPLVERIREVAFRALRDARLEPSAVEHVLPVGGASRMPCVTRLARTLFERAPLRSLAVDEVVAQGAALQAALKVGDRALDDLIVTDVAAFTLGVEVVDFCSGRMVPGVFSPILERGTVIPASRAQHYQTVAERQEEIHLRVYQGEHPSCRKNLRIGELMVGGLSPLPAGREEVEVRFSYDLNGVLEVDATVASTGVKHHLLIEQSPGRLGSRELEEARRRLQSLKFHPREALPNAAALSKAEALYVELRGPARHRLGHAISAFQAALEGGEPRTIDGVREELLALIEALA